MKSTQIKSWLKTKLLNSIIPARDKILKSLGRTDFDTIYFEGGLGSQILNYLDFYQFPRKVDLSYFRSPPTADGIGPDVWNWELGMYGIQLEDFAKFENKKPFNPWKTRRPSSLEVSNRLLNSTTKKIHQQIEPAKNLFPIDIEKLNALCKEFNLNLNETTCVHIRRGDYVRVASRLIEFQEYEELLQTIAICIDKNLIFISDSKLPNEIKARFAERFPRINISFFTSDEIPTKSAHDIMRTCKVLVTANSTFSISAGLLSNENTLVLSPIDYFGGKDGYMKSRIFNRNGEFFVMRKNPT